VANLNFRKTPLKLPPLETLIRLHKKAGMPINNIIVSLTWSNIINQTRNQNKKRVDHMVWGAWCPSPAGPFSEQLPVPCLPRLPWNRWLVPPLSC